MMRYGRNTILRLAIALLCLGLAAAPIRAAQIVTQGEDYIDYYDLGGLLIGPYPVGVITVLQGLDISVEWVEYTLPVSAYGSYSFSMICWGDLYVPYTFNVYFIPESGGFQQQISVSFTGKGCFT